MSSKKYFVPVAIVFISFLSPPMAHSIYGGTASISAPNVVTIIKEYADGNRYGGCSGALLSAQVVVTAAHCVTDSETGLVAKTIWVTPPGAKWKSHEEGGKTWNILDNATTVAESRAIYEEYKAISVQLTSTYFSASSIVEDNDVAFLVIENVLPLTTPITLASDQETEDFIAKEATARLYGYGITEFEGATSKVPMTTTMSFAYKSNSVANSAYLISPSSSACPGDSGGPVIVSTPSRLYLVGIISGGPTSQSGPACSSMISGNYYTLITLVTKYANLAFQAATIAASASETNKVNSEGAATVAEAAHAKAEVDAKIAKDAQAKAEAEVKTATDSQAKAEAEVKTATDSQNRAESESRMANEALTKSEAAANAALNASSVLSGEVERLRTNLTNLGSQIATLTNSLKAVQTTNDKLTKKLAALCKSKPKPKGC